MKVEVGDTSTMKLLLFLAIFALSRSQSSSLSKYMQCETVQPTGRISNCEVDFTVVNKAVTNFFSPILNDVTKRTFFRYFKVNLDRPCPFWDEDGQCAMEKCSVCTCDEDEIPRLWLKGKSAEKIEVDDDDEVGQYGWISVEEKDSNNDFDSSTASVSFRGDDKQHMQYLKETEDCNIGDWIDMDESKEYNEESVYVNLLDNPETYTGYAGPSAQRVWQSIQKENCFGGLADVCTEKRLFYRLMSGLQASISTHIAMNYYYPDDGRWDTNIPLFVRAVGSHPDRLENLYLAFLFVLRAVVKSGDFLTNYGYHTGHEFDDVAVKELITKLVSGRMPANRLDDTTDFLSTSLNPSVPIDVSMVGLEECRNGFDESLLFQVPVREEYANWANWAGGDHFRLMNEKQALMEEFKLRFRNISRIMDCVSCEKCRVWGKLQILGLGTAIKVLLTPEQQITMSSSRPFGHKALNRQEIIALINTLTQLAKSVKFAAHAADLELKAKLSEVAVKIASFGGLTSLAIIAVYFIYCKFVDSRKKME